MRLHKPWYLHPNTPAEVFEVIEARTASRTPRRTLTLSTAPITSGEPRDPFAAPKQGIHTDELEAELAFAHARYMSPTLLAGPV